MEKYKHTFSTLNETRMIPVFYHADLSTCKNIVISCYNGGVRAFEFTNRGDNALENFSALKKYCSTNFPDLLLGAGTILTVKNANDFINAGADFIVSPILKEEILIACRQQNIYAIPGCMTLSEIAQAQEWGCDIIKLFPGSVLGPQFVSAVLGPMPKLKLMPTGGVEPTKENLQAWFQAGVVCVGMGSQLLSNKIIASENYSQLTTEIKTVLSIINDISK